MFKKLTTEEKYQKFFKNLFAYETCSSQYGDKCSNGYCKKAILHLEDNATAYFTCGKEEGKTTPKCPYCNNPTYLHSGNPIYSYWLCKVCNKTFVYDIYAEKICQEYNIEL